MFVKIEILFLKKQSVSLKHILWTYNQRIMNVNFAISFHQSTIILMSSSYWKLLLFIKICWLCYNCMQPLLRNSMENEASQMYPCINKTITSLQTGMVSRVHMLWTKYKVKSFFMNTEIQLFLIAFLSFKYCNPRQLRKYSKFKVYESKFKTEMANAIFFHVFLGKSLKNHDINRNWYEVYNKDYMTWKINQKTLINT